MKSSTIFTKSHLTTFLVMWSKAEAFIVSFLRSMSAFCRVQASSIMRPLVAREIATAQQNLELSDYPDPERIKVESKIDLLIV